MLQKQAYIKSNRTRYTLKKHNLSTTYNTTEHICRFSWNLQISMWLNIKLLSLWIVKALSKQYISFGIVSSIRLGVAVSGSLWIIFRVPFAQKKEKENSTYRSLINNSKENESIGNYKISLLTVFSVCLSGNIFFLNKSWKHRMNV